ncbi:MAG: hypothetical protein ACNI27_16860 [Desulfovibrio sp.]
MKATKYYYRFIWGSAYLSIFFCMSFFIFGVSLIGMTASVWNDPQLLLDPSTLPFLFVPLIMGFVSTRFLYASSCDEAHLRVVGILGQKTIPMEEIQYFTILNSVLYGLKWTDFRHGAVIRTRGKFSPKHFYIISSNTKVALALRLLKNDIPYKSDTLGFSKIYGEDKSLLKDLERLKRQDL